MVMRALRGIRAGEQVTDSYVWLGMAGPQRRAALERSHGFTCYCERCAASPGSVLYELERSQLSLVCPEVSGESTACNGVHGDGGQHRLLPVDTYAEIPDYVCAKPDSSASLIGEEARRRVRSACADFEALNAMLEKGEYEEGCRAAR